jgi:hypothetical protein
LDVFFYGGSFMKPVTDVDVHEHLKLANDAAQTSAFYENCTPAEEHSKAGIRSAIRLFDSFGNGRRSSILEEQFSEEIICTRSLRQL